MPETEMYNTICKHEFKEVKDVLEDISDKVNKLYNDKYIGNGKDSDNIRLDRLEGFKRVSCWLFGAVALQGIAIFSKIIYELLK